MADPIIIASIEKNSRETIRIALHEYRGHQLVDVRIFAVWGNEDEAQPTKKGVSIRIEQLDELIAALHAAAAEIARRQ